MLSQTQRLLTPFKKECRLHFEAVRRVAHVHNAVAFRNRISWLYSKAIIQGGLRYPHGCLRASRLDPEVVLHIFHHVNTAKDYHQSIAHPKEPRGLLSRPQGPVWTGFLADPP